MDFLAEKFIAFSKHLRDELSALRQSIEALRKQQERQHQEKQAQRELPPPSVQIAGEIKAEIHETKDNERQKRAYTYANLGIQAFLALGTWLAFLAAAYYASIARGQLDQMKISTQAAARQAEIAERTFNATVEQFHLDQRAWVGLVQLAKSDIRENAKPTFVLHLLNSGRTPALELESKAACGSYLKSEGFNPEHYPNTKIAHSTSVLLPNVPLILDCESPVLLTAAQVNAVKEGLTIPRIWGTITYKDVFQRRHHTKFCIFIGPDLVTPNVCPNYNEAD